MQSIKKLVDIGPDKDYNIFNTQIYENNQPSKIKFQYTFLMLQNLSNISLILQLNKS